MEKGIRNLMLFAFISCCVLGGILGLMAGKMQQMQEQINRYAEEVNDRE